MSADVKAPGAEPAARDSGPVQSVAGSARGARLRETLKNILLQRSSQVGLIILTILVASAGRRTLYPFRFRREFAAERGAGGQGRQKTGHSGQDLVIELPPGTIVRDADTGDIVKDFSVAGESFIIARGGRGGNGGLHLIRSHVPGRKKDRLLADPADDAVPPIGNHRPERLANGEELE